MKDEKRMELPKITIDDLFTTQEEIDNKNMEKIVEIPIDKITDFPNHPYKVIDNEEMKELSNSIKENGLFNAVIVRKKENGWYEMISGHRRKRGAVLAGMKNIKAIVKDLTDEEAIILMVDSNQNQREEILPSEKAFAYKMKMDALKKQGARIDLTSCPVGEKLKIEEILAEDSGESARNIQRFIRLTELIPKILNMVDEKQIAFRPAVEISFLTKKEQRWLLDSMRYNDATPSLAQTIKMKKLSKENRLDEDEIELIKILKTIGYEFYFRADQMSIRMQPRKRYFRVERNLGNEYSLQRIKERIYEEFIDLNVFYKTEYKTLNGYYICKRNKVKSRAKGFIGLYRYYCYLLKVYPKRNWQHRLSYETRKAIKQLDKYTNQLTFVEQNKIHNFNDLEKIKNLKKEELKKAYNYRNRLYYSRNNSDNKEQFTEKIIEATKQINAIKSEIKICNDIQIEVVKIKEQIKEFYQKEEEREKNFIKRKKRGKRILTKQKN